MKFHYDTFPTPAGDFSAAFDDTGAVHATAFGGLTQLRTRLAKGRTLGAPRKSPAIRAAVGAYFSTGETSSDLQLSASGSAFQQKVWAELQRIPRGETRSYGDLARQLGSSPRAVGRANATNPICLFIPCHRVIGADGTLTGYAFGEPIKQRLLEHEGALAPGLA